MEGQTSSPNEPEDTKKTEKKYDIALSFAGEDRPFLEEVAEILRDSGIKVFYDGFEDSNLWGKNSYTYLKEIYRDKSRYTIMFCSKHYADKRWTNHERESAQERALRENFEYILRARFDDTDIPGLPETTAYINLEGKTPFEFCLIVGKKLNLRIKKKNKANQTLNESVSEILDEEDSLTIPELENRNRYWDDYQKYMNSMNDKTRFLYQKKNSLYYLEKYNLSIKVIKKYLLSLGCFK